MGSNPARVTSETNQVLLAGGHVFFFSGISRFRPTLRLTRLKMSKIILTGLNHPQTNKKKKKKKKNNNKKTTTKKTKQKKKTKKKQKKQKKNKKKKQQKKTKTKKNKKKQQQKNNNKTKKTTTKKKKKKKKKNTNSYVCRHTKSPLQSSIDRCFFMRFPLKCFGCIHL